MNGEELSPEDHIVRYVKPSSMHEGRVDGSEFQLSPRRADDKGVSVNWLECYADCPKEARLAEVRRVIRLELRRNGRFAELNVGEVKRHLAEKLPSLRIIRAPLDAEGELEADPSHSEITELPEPGSDRAEIIGDMIAECVCELHPAIAE